MARIPFMEMLFPKQSPQAGSSPGVIVADPKAAAPEVTLMGFGPEACTEPIPADPAAARAMVGRYPVVWINVEGLGDAEVIRSLGECFEIHRLALEDVINVNQRPKFEEYGDKDLVILRVPSPRGGGATDQLSLILGEGYVISFFEHPQPFVASIRERIQQLRPRLVGGGADYLAYAILDAATDSFFSLLEAFGDALEAAEDRIIEGRSGNTDSVRDIHASKRELFYLNRILRQIRQAFEEMQTEDLPLIAESTLLHLRDCHDHASQLITLCETLQEGFAGLIDLQLSMSGQRLNEAMRVLTIIATIFIPLSFIAGLYGMNFDAEGSPWNMPELAWRYGYPFALGLMLVVVLGLMVFFRRKGWMGGTVRRDENEKN